ncbi:hypothetical protein MKW92_015071, partial [Papaver armeniacum]
MLPLLFTTQSEKTATSTVGNLVNELSGHGIGAKVTAASDVIALNSVVQDMCSGYKVKTTGKCTRWRPDLFMEYVISSIDGETRSFHGDVAERNALIEANQIS